MGSLQLVLSKWSHKDLSKLQSEGIDFYYQSWNDACVLEVIKPH